MARPVQRVLRALGQHRIQPDVSDGLSKRSGPHGSNSPLGASSPRRSLSQHGGFTLIEVLVALGIVAIALVAALQAVGALTRDAQRQSDVLLAHICAENEMIKTRLSRQMPGVGNDDVACDQAGRAYRVTLSVLPTPNPNFRRVDAQVLQDGAPVLRLSTVLGRY